MLDLPGPFIRRRYAVISHAVEEKTDYNPIKKAVGNIHAVGSFSSTLSLLPGVGLFLLLDIQWCNRKLVGEMIPADLSWHPPDIRRLPVAKKHTS